ncbi:hypothetical protein OnM2_078038 [Erysiphe neolycopersici]|uniref:Uncharacterized protein n=1 Tax=Erysiphe neolycopersici TaxID=212602 RepID=A0A420HHB5_9PEZI|nr:hypothetical protein OnM2_078038 [Erysiphe neolycopersici]
MIEYKKEIAIQKNGPKNCLNDSFQNNLFVQKPNILNPFFCSNTVAIRKNADMNDIDRFLAINLYVIDIIGIKIFRNDVLKYLIVEFEELKNEKLIQKKNQLQYVEELWAGFSTVMGLYKTPFLNSEFNYGNKIEYPISCVKLSKRKGKRSNQMHFYLSATTHKQPKPTFNLSRKNRGQLDYYFENTSHYKDDTYSKLGRFYGIYDGAASDEENKDSRSLYKPKPNITMGKAPFDRFTSNKESESSWHQALVNRTGRGPTENTEEKRYENKFTNMPGVVHGAPPKSAISILKGLKLKSQKEVILEKQMAAAEKYRQEISARKNKKDEAINSWQAELEITESIAKYKSRKLLKPAKVDRRFPTSWSRYSSHDRAERLARSLSHEQIKVRDFANLGYKNNEIVWCLAHDANGHKTELDEISQKTKFKQRIENSAVVFLYKINVRDVQNQAGRARGRRGSISVAGEMEFPELELLPISLMTEIEIAHEVQEDERKQAERELKKIKINMMEKVKKEREIEDNLLRAEGHVRRHESFSEVLLYSDVVDIIADVVVDSVVVVETVPTSSSPNVLNSVGLPDIFFAEQEN